MQALQTFIRNLAIILLLATFMEMLLPNNSMRGYVQLVMGLFVISAILNPLTTFLHHPLELEIPAWTAAPSQDMPVLAADGAKLGKDAVEVQYRLILEHQIRALALGVTGVGDAAVEINLGQSSPSFTDQPRISGVEITLSAAQGTVEPVQPVVIGAKEQAANRDPRNANSDSKKANEPSAESQVTREVREKVAKLMELQEEKIYVHF